MGRWVQPKGKGEPIRRDDKDRISHAAFPGETHHAVIICIRCNSFEMCNVDILISSFPRKLPERIIKYECSFYATKGGYLKMTIEERVLNIIIEQLNVTKEECVPEAKFIDDLGADSLDLVELIMAMEDHFGLEISDDDLGKISTIQDVISYITTLVK